MNGINYGAASAFALAVLATPHLGNQVIGFSASSSTINPQLRYAGRLVTDPPNILTGEQHLF